MNEELYRNKLHVDSPTSISIGYCSWFGLDTKLVGKIKRMIEENQQQKEVIEEIREYIKELDDNTDDTTCYDIDRNAREDILQILDKYKN